MSYNNLPKNWEITKVYQLSNHIRGVNYKKDVVINFEKDGYCLVLRGGNIQEGKILTDADNVFVPKEFINNIQFLRKGDVVIVSSTGSNNLIGKAAHALQTSTDISFGAFLCLLRPSTLINPFFFGYYFQTNIYRNSIRELAAGININNIKTDHLYNLFFPLPPLNEQNRIVEKLDRLFAKIDSINERMENIPELIKQFRQSVLHAAVTGKLTEEWRKNNDFTWNNELKDAKENKIHWKILNSSEACIKVQNGTTPRNNPFRLVGDIPFLKVYNIQDQIISFDYKPQFIDRDIHESTLKRSIVLPYDVIINIVGPPLGKVALVTSQFPEWNINQAIILFRPKKFLLPQYLFYFLCEGSEIFKYQSEYKGSAGQTNISVSQCRNFKIKIPSIDEQAEIISHVEKLFNIANNIEEHYRNLKVQLENLPQAILAKAFRGELVPQDPNDEPAEQLLQRILEEKAKLECKTRKLKNQMDMAAEPEGEYKSHKKVR